MNLTLHEIALALGIEPPEAAEFTVTGYSIDSRTLRRGELFFAVRGERLDGHDYVLRALEAGAAGAVVDAAKLEKFPPSVKPKLMAVPDTLRSLQQLARFVRNRWDGPIVAVTGSAGKTTTKQAIGAMLATRFRVLESEGNLNNHFGLPLSLLRLRPETEVGVFELGMSAPGEIRLLAGLAKPDLGVVTNVGAVHLEFFPNVDAIARAKYELIESLPPDAWAVLNADDPRVRLFGDRMAGRVLLFGINQPAHFQAQELAAAAGGGFVFTLPAKSYEGIQPGSLRGGAFSVPGPVANAFSDVQFHLPLLGRHNVLNVLAALAVCYTFGIPPSALREAVAALRPGTMRGEMVRLASGALAVQDCYNSNPEALEMMLAAVAALPARRRLAVLGGMMELGSASEELHRQGGRRVAELGFDGLVTVGEPARAFEAGALAAGMAPQALLHFETPEEAAAHLRERLQEGDVVLLKASRAVHLEKIRQEWEKAVIQGV